MQRTPNLGLPQFEPSDKYRLEDYNEAYTKIDEKIKELDDKEAQLDTKLAEAQSIIDTWTQFKNTGGSVGGSINANDKISLNGDEISFRSKKHNRGLVFNDKVTTIYDWVRNRHIFRVDETNSMSTVYANDFYFGQYSKNTNGYTKLPNGLLLQWGFISNNISSGKSNTTVTYPIEFPNKVVSIVANVSSLDSSSTGIVSRTHCWTYSVSRAKFNLNVNNIDGYGSYFDANWIAIGY